MLGSPNAPVFTLQNGESSKRCTSLYLRAARPLFSFDLWERKKAVSLATRDYTYARVGGGLGALCYTHIADFVELWLTAHAAPSVNEVF